MPKRNGHVPSYRLHKPSGQARVIINGEHVYLGRYGSAESREKYARLIAEIPANGDSAAVPTPVSNGHPAISINELLLAYWQFAETYYSKDGQPTKELENMKDAIWPLHQLYGLTPADDFGPQALKAVRQYMVTEQGLCRNVVNHRISRIKRVFKWAVAEELVPPSTFHGLQALAGLRYGRTEARETEPVKPVDDHARRRHAALRDAARACHDPGPATDRHASRRCRVHAALRYRPIRRGLDLRAPRPQEPLAWTPPADSDRAQGSGRPEAVHGPRPGSVPVQPQGIGGLAEGDASCQRWQEPQDEDLPVRAAGQGGEKGSPSAAKAQT